MFFFLTLKILQILLTPTPVWDWYMTLILFPFNQYFWCFTNAVSPNFSDIFNLLTEQLAFNWGCDVHTALALSDDFKLNKGRWTNLNFKLSKGKWTNLNFKVNKGKWANLFRQNISVERCRLTNGVTGQVVSNWGWVGTSRDSAVTAEPHADHSPKPFQKLVQNIYSKLFTNTF